MAGHFFGHREMRGKVSQAHRDSDVPRSLGNTAILTQDKVQPAGGQLFKYPLYVAEANS